MLILKDRKNKICETNYYDFESSIIKTSKFQYLPEGMVNTEFYNFEGNLVVSIKLPLEYYNTQFGVSINYENTLALVQCWEKGLRCYSLSDGTMLWKNSLKKVEKIVIYGRYALCQISSKGLYKINIIDGTVEELIYKNKDYHSKLFQFEKEYAIITYSSKIDCIDLEKLKIWTTSIDLYNNASSDRDIIVSKITIQTDIIIIDCFTQDEEFQKVIALKEILAGHTR